MELRKRVTVLVPSELVYAFDPDREHVFVAAQERGRIVARPMEEYICLRKCDSHRRQYLNGFAAGMATSYEDGYRQDYNDGRDNLSYDASQAEHDWWDDDDYVSSHCPGDCETCRYYDDINGSCDRN